MLDRSNLAPTVKAKAAALFQRLAEAEGAVHGIAPETVHFHEVGAVDSIVDIVGTVAAIDWLGATRVAASPLNTGSGTVTCAHGVMPVPAPATARLLTGVPVYAVGPAVELLTPTGALLVSGHATSYGPLPPMTVERVGYGAGDHEFPDRANVVRIFVGAPVASAAGGDPAAAQSTVTESLRVFECELDDLNPQVLGTLMTRLLASGARDVFYTPVQMKKGRPGTLVTVLARPESADPLLDMLFAETTTLGVRVQDVRREILERESRPVATAYGEVRMKVGLRHGRMVNAAPEYDDCVRLAEAGGVPVKEVLAAATHAWRAALSAKARA